VLDQFIWRCTIRTIGSYEAKTHLAQLLEEVAKGERVTITRHGNPVATLQPANPAAMTDVRERIEELKKFRRGRSLKGLSLREMIEEGRR
jgi:prevent-host-death family protein